MTAYQVQRDDAWAHALLVWLVAFNSLAIKPSTLAMASLADPARQYLLDESRVDARRGAYQERCNNNNQETSQPFLDYR